MVPFYRPFPWTGPTVRAGAGRSEPAKSHTMSLSSPLVSDINVVDSAVLPAPEYLGREIVRDDAAAQTVVSAREALHRIIFGDDRRVMVVVGPCSIHDAKAGREYAERLAALAAEIGDRIYLVMRVYFEKPRTTVGWKGLIMDPGLDGTCNIPEGLKAARRFLLDVLRLGLPTGTELLDPITPQYIADLVCWSAIGARTTESQTHRQMASGLSMPLGFKNSTSGNIEVAINAIKAAAQPQTFLGISHQGLASAITTRGNPNAHIILRGGESGTNYDAASVTKTAARLRDRGCIPAIMVDCSHANSAKDHNRQADVFREVIAQASGNPRSPVIGLMLESNLREGNQPFPGPTGNLVYGQSITDACIKWETTEALLREAHEALAPRFA